MFLISLLGFCVTSYVIKLMFIALF